MDKKEGEEKINHQHIMIAVLKQLRRQQMHLPEMAPNCLWVPYSILQRTFSNFSLGVQSSASN